MAAEDEHLAERPVAASGEAHTRGFLFADIRGYTEYVERRGATAAAEMLGRYRVAVRAAIAEYRGAEIRTEGDSFYVVLPSASSAVVCALAILDRVNAENAGGTDETIRVGIGVHAGEAIDSKEGLVGSAINIAARLSALAKPGEVLVSDTVRSLTRSVIPVAYVPRGRHRLKGVADIQDVFAAATSTPGAAPIRTRRVAGPVAAAAGAVVLAAIVGLVYVALPAGTPTATATPSAAAALPTSTTIPTSTTASTAAASATESASANPGPSVIRVPTQDSSYSGGGVAALIPRSYRFNSFRPIVVFQVYPSWTDRGWHAMFAATDRALLVLTRAGLDCCGFPLVDRIDPGDMLVEFAHLQTVLGNPCDPGDLGSTKLLGGSPRDVIDWLSQHRFLTASNLRPVTVGAWTGLSIDVVVAGDPGIECAGLQVPHQGSVYLFRTTQSDLPGTLFKLRDGQQARFTVLDIGADTPLVLVSFSAVADFQGRVQWSDDLISTMTPGD